MMGPSHQARVNGTTWAFHQRIHVFRMGSPESCGIREVMERAMGHVQKIARTEKPRSAQKDSDLTVFGNNATSL